MTTNQQSFPAQVWGWLRRIAPALVVFFMAPITAEYLTGYDTSTGNIGALLFGLLFFGPLYGGPALIIREVTRRSGRSWPTMIVLGVACGVIQAGLIDHSLFNDSYRDIGNWQEQREPTYIPALGIGAGMALNFIPGHAIWSFSVPIAIAEALTPSRRTTPWLGAFGLAIVTLLYLLVATLIFFDHVESEQFLPSTPQLIGTAVVVITLIGVAFAIGKRQRPAVARLAPGSCQSPKKEGLGEAFASPKPSPPRFGPASSGRTGAGRRMRWASPLALPDFDMALRLAPSPWLVGIVSFIALSLSIIIEIIVSIFGISTTFGVDWWGVAVTSGSFVGLAIALVRWSRSECWGAIHIVAAAGGALLSRATIAFLVPPIGDVPLFNKLTHNVILLIGSLTLLVIAARTIKRT